MKEGFRKRCKQDSGGTGSTRHKARNSRTSSDDIVYDKNHDASDFDDSQAQNKTQMYATIKFTIRVKTGSVHLKDSTKLAIVSTLSLSFLRPGSEDPRGPMHTR